MGKADGMGTATLPYILYKYIIYKVTTFEGYATNIQIT